MTLIQLVILLGVLWFANKGLARYFVDVFITVRWVVLGFAGYFIVSLFLVFFATLRPSALDGPMRLLLALTCIAFVGWFRPRIQALWFGLCLGSIGAAVIALVERLAFGIERVMGATHHPITFGNLALALGLMSLCALSAFRGKRYAFLPILSFLCGLVASILSGSRGGWVGLFLCMIPLLYFGYKAHGRAVIYAVVLAVSLFFIAYLIPGTGLSERVGRVFQEFDLYFVHGEVETSLGVRLELWKASWMMFSEHPLWGVGRGQFQPVLLELVAEGKLRPSIATTFSSSHNDMLHVLATGGLRDFSFLLLFYLGPLLLFLSVLKGRLEGDKQAALAGLLLVVSFFGFGLTDVMFWLMSPTIFYAMMVCVLIGFCVMRREG